MEIQRIDSYTDPRFSQEILYQHGAFLVDGAPWSFRVISDHEAVVSAERTGPEVLAEAVEYFRFYGEHITTFYDQEGSLLLDLPPVERREVEISILQPSQFSVDREKCAAVRHFLHTAADLVIPTMILPDGTLCVLDGHTRLREAWRQGIRRAMVFDSPMPSGQRAIMEDFVREARAREIFHIQDMAVYGSQEQKEKWHDWCSAYFAARQEAGQKE